jgi:glutaredoxin-related protein
MRGNSASHFPSVDVTAAITREIAMVVMGKPPPPMCGFSSTKGLAVITLHHSHHQMVSLLPAGSGLIARPVTDSG